MMNVRKCFTVLIVITLVVTGTALGAEEKSYDGVKLVVATQVGPHISGPVITHRDAWREMTGGQIEVIEIPHENLFEKIMTPFLTGTHAYDIIIFATGWSGDIMGNKFVIPLDHYLKDNKDWDDIMPLYRERLVQWGDSVYGIPVDGDVHMTYYRKDGIENKEYQQLFETKYGYPLAPPKTWKEYVDMAEFFNRWDWDNDGEIEYGVVEVMGRGTQNVYTYLSHAAPYVVTPEQPDGLFFDALTMKALINSPGHVEALKDWIALVEFGPSGMLNYHVGQIFSDFAQGRAMFTLDWGDVGTVSADPETSQVRGKVGYIMCPGAEQYWNYEKNMWISPEKGINYAPFIAWGGWIAGITTTCKNPDAAYDFLAYLNSPEISMIDVTSPSTGYNPYRYTHFENVEEWIKMGFSVEEARGYLDAIQSCIDHPNAVLDLRIPGLAQYYDVLDLQLSRALAGEVGAQEALNIVAEEWDQITDRLGKDQQLPFYRESLGLPPL